MRVGIHSIHCHTDKEYFINHGMEFTKPMNHIYDVTFTLHCIVYGKPYFHGMTFLLYCLHKEFDISSKIFCNLECFSF